MPDCEFMERSRRSGEVLELCSLNGRFCFCPVDFRACTRRTWALEHPAVQDPDRDAAKSPE